MNAARSAPVDYRELLSRYGDSHWWIAGMRRITWAIAGPADGWLLDVGCGPGWLLTELPAGLRGVGIDLRIDGTVARPMVAADAGRLPFMEAAFDWVTALDVLEQHQVDPGTVLVETRRVLKPAGRLLVRVPAFPELYGPHDRMWGGARRYKRGELEVLVQDAGFVVRRLTYANSLLFLTGAITRLLARTTSSFSNDLHPLPAPVNSLLFGILSLEARWLRTHDFKAGLSLFCLAQKPA